MKDPLLSVANTTTVDELRKKDIEGAHPSTVLLSLYFLSTTRLKRTAYRRQHKQAKFKSNSHYSGVVETGGIGGMVSILNLDM